MEVIKTSIPGVFIIEPKVFGDHRGYFFESFNAKEFAEKTGFEVTSFLPTRKANLLELSRERCWM